MKNDSTEKYLAKFLAFGAFFTTIFVISGQVTDPVNAPKLLILGITGASSITIVLATKLRHKLKSNYFVVTLIVSFMLQMLISSILSDSPFSQNIYGSYGRNNGFLTYFFLGLIFCSVLCFSSLDSFKLLIKSFITAGVLNLIYNLWVLTFGDFIGWNNPYESILGTFGNPNFIGAFLGMLFTVLFALVLTSNIVLRNRAFIFFGMLVCFFEIVKSHAIQGIVVAIFGSMIVLFMYIRSRFRKPILYTYSLVSILIGVLALAGAMQKGPLLEFVYKTSVSLRGQYWRAGWNTGMANPFSGAGMDSFGDFYRRMREARALELPGINTVVNAAHNVPIDIFAFGGWPLFIIYLLILIMAGRAAFLIVFRQKVFLAHEAILVSTWAGYQLQSIISINQIGLAIWGWVLSAALISYQLQMKHNLNTVNKNLDTLKPASNIQQSVLHIPLIAFIGAIIGALLSIPPLTSDLFWRKAQVSQSLPMIQQSMIATYFNPLNTQKFVDNIDALERSKLYDESRKYALQAVKWNPNSFDLWKLLYLVQNSTNEEKKLAIKNMMKLDPLNPDVTAIK